MTAATGPGGVLFDLDGTLVDSSDAHRAALRRAAQACGLPVPGAVALALAQRPTDLDTVRALVGPRRLPLAWPAYQREILRRVDEQGVPTIGGATATVAALRRLGAVLGVCTGRSREQAAALLRASGLDLPLTVAREDAPRPKPAGDALTVACRRLGLTPAACLYVGDTEADAEQGRRAGVPTVVLGPGGMDTEDLLRRYRGTAGAVVARGDGR